VLAVTEVLIECDIRSIEVTMNSPEPLTSIELMTKEFGQQATIGAGTVTKITEVEDVASAGGKFIVSPNCNEAIIRHTKALQLGSYPGVFTATECFSALSAGADALKVFPASLIGPQGIKELKAVLPMSTALFAVGGISFENINIWKDAGVFGYGIGSSLYKPGKSINDIRTSALQLKKII
ncbi:uncharacterized protein METZ01_LOCUS53771, partial [marine metagenome]